MTKRKLVRITTVPLSLDKLLDGQLSFMNRYFEVVAISSDPEYLNKVSQKEMIRVFPLDLTRKITPFKDLKAVYRLYKFLRKEKPFIVHTHTPKAGSVGMAAAKLAGVPHRLHTIAGLPLLEVKGLKRRLLNLVERVTYFCSTKIYPNSFGLQNIILEEGFCKRSKTKVIAQGSTNGIDTSYFNKTNFSEIDTKSLKEALGIAPGFLVYIFVGRLVGDKGINELISAFSSLSNGKVKLLLVGPFEDEFDPLDDKTLNEIRDNPNIVSVGYQKDVRLYFAIADVLVFPSYREGFPNVVMQAGAMGLPSIVTNINGCNEIIENELNGLIVAVKDSLALKESMLRLLENEDLRISLRNNARKMVTSRYEQLLVWKALLAEYESLI